MQPRCLTAFETYEQNTHTQRGNIGICLNNVKDTPQASLAAMPRSLRKLGLAVRCFFQPILKHCTNLLRILCRLSVFVEDCESWCTASAKGFVCDAHRAGANRLQNRVNQTRADSHVVAANTSQPIPLVGAPVMD